VPSADKRQRQKENARQAREARIAAEKRSRRLKSIRNVGIIAVLFVIMVVVVTLIQGGNDKKKSSSTSSTTTPTTAVTPTTVKDAALAADKTYTATIATNMGEIKVQLDQKEDPIGAAHFVANANAGVYNGSKWHRVVKDFVIQGGAPGGDATKDYGKVVVGKVPTDHYPVGVIAAAKTADAPAGTFDSQFFIVTGQKQGADLPNDYARFGKVTSGMDVVTKIENLAVDSSQDPTTKATIDKVTITES
jgi:cyclophilin family peptidyl-prolyl cis-trans isomerase